MVFNVDRASNKVFASVANGGQTDRYECVLTVCQNPTCRCRAVHMTLIAEPSERQQGNVQKPQVYNDILPFGDRLLIGIDGVEHILFDQHCVRVGCDCAVTYIELAPMMADGHPGGHAGTIMVDYKSKQWQTVADDVAPHDLPALRQLIENESPDFYRRLSRRHSKLQAIYAHCRKRHLANQRQAKTMLPKSVGRNDPCPCGSGKKYKKCCLQ